MVYLSERVERQLNIRASRRLLVTPANRIYTRRYGPGTVGASTSGQFRSTTGRERLGTRIAQQRVEGSDADDGGLSEPSCSSDRC